MFGYFKGPMEVISPTISIKIVGLLDGLNSDNINYTGENQSDCDSVQ